MATELTPSEYEKLTAAGKVPAPQPRPYTRWAIAAAAVIVLCGLSFVAGESYQKNHRTAATTATNQSRAFGPGGGFRNRQRSVIGQVTAVSDSSITITTTQNASQTFKITSSTTIDNNGATATTSDIKTGDTVLVQTVVGDTTTARRILLNPAAGTPQDNSATPSSSSAPTLSN